MRILIIVHTYFPYSSGGTEMYVNSLVNQLSNRHTIFILHTFESQQNTSFLPQKSFISQNIISIALPKRIPETYEMTYYNKYYGEIFRDILKECSPDIIHINHLLFHSLYYLEQIIEMGIPVIVTLHDYWYICPQCFLTRIDGSLCEGPGITGEICLECDNAEPSRYVPFANVVTSDKRKAHLLSKIKFLLPSFIKRSARYLLMVIKSRSKKYRENRLIVIDRLKKAVSLLNKVNLIIAPSPVLAERYMNAGVKDIKIVPHGIEIPSVNLTVENKYSDIGKRRIIFGYMGGFLSHKGAEVIVEAFNNITSGDAELWIFGSRGVDIRYEKRVLRKIQNPFVKIIGFIEHSKIFDVLKDIDVLVVPSMCAENFPLVIMEAFAAKIPVIASNVGGIKVIVKDGVNGFLFEKGDVKALTDIIKKIIKNKYIILELSKKIPHVKSIKEHAEEIENIYEKIIASKKDK
ncbi:MAG: glycosyltransferase [Chitinispirillaceae bacterium]|nr:glycosyltransferase [Chitinispirillaceae bacterium]